MKCDEQVQRGAVTVGCDGTYSAVWYIGSLGAREPFSERQGQKPSLAAQLIEGAADRIPILILVIKAGVVRIAHRMNHAFEPINRAYRAQSESSTRNSNTLYLARIVSVHPALDEIGPHIQRGMGRRGLECASKQAIHFVDRRHANNSVARERGCLLSGLDASPNGVRSGFAKLADWIMSEERDGYAGQAKVQRSQVRYQLPERLFIAVPCRERDHDALQGMRNGRIAATGADKIQPLLLVLEGV